LPLAHRLFGKRQYDKEVLMSAQLNELIERIRKEGLEAAEQEAARVRQKAEEDASRILEEARAQGESLVEQAKAEAQRFEQTGREGVRQAARDVILGLRKDLERTAAAVLRARVTDALKGDAVKEALASLFRNWRADSELPYDVLVPAAAWDAMRDSLLADLADQVRRGLTIKPSSSVLAGFRVSEKNGAAYFDFTDSALAEYLMEHLNSRLAACLEEKPD
jgi:V/A-type H+-transporting ATPase subunit E